MLNTRQELRFFGPILGLTLVALAFLAGTLWFWTRDMDQKSLRLDQGLIEAGIVSMGQWAEEDLHNNVYDDEMTEKVAISFDPDWTQAEVANYLTRHQGFEKIFVLNSKDQPVIGSFEGVAMTPDRFEMIRVETEILRETVRLMERGTRSAAQLHGLPPLKATHSAHIVRVVDGKAYYIAAALILPRKRTLRPAGNAPMVIGLRPIEGRRLNRFAEESKLQGLKLLNRVQAKPNGYALTQIKNEVGDAAFYATWKARMPGEELFAKSLLPLGVATLTMILGAALIALHGRRVTDSLLASEARAKHMAVHDSLTGLPNRILFQERFTQATDRLRRKDGSVAVLCIGLDRFKEVNDTLGHLAGDEMIVKTAQALSGILRAGDTVARLGGDEFVIILNDADGRAAASMAKRVLEALTGPMVLSAGQVYSGCSIGVSVVTDADTDAGEALRQAELALYKAKDRGRGQSCFFEPDMDATLRLRKDMEAGLREALARDEIQIVYQPQVNSRGVVIGVEALSRWTHPERGPVSPGYFIPLAEECGLMDTLGMFALAQAMMDSHRWPNLKVAVNVSASQLRQAGFTDRVKALLEQTNTPAARIEIEITEGVLLADDTVTQTTLRQLRDMGFSLALDDFGTGYSSLSYLRRYPVDKIKIDRAFVCNLGTDPEAEAVVRAIVKLAQALHLDLVAEGVETMEQREILQAAGCYVIQGFLFSKPVDADTIDAMTRSNPGIGRAQSMAALK